MLPYLAAAGHNNYVKSLVLFLNKMEKLQNTHPNVYRHFVKDGLFVIRRTDNYWAGIFPDLCIEQVLMGSIKSVGGLTRGRGFDDSTSLVWLLSMPTCAEIHKAIEEVCDANDTGVDVHKDLFKARLHRDPFKSDQGLCSLSSGVIADTSVNVDSAKQIGSQIVASMCDKSVSEFKFSKKNQVNTLTSVLYVSTDAEKVEIDPKKI